jgi:hypothetical protein
MTDRRDFGRKYELNVGDRFGKLLVTQVRPGLRMMCDCGTEVTDRVPSHVVRSRLKSCGCLRRNTAKKAGDQHNDWTLVEKTQDGPNAYLRKWLCRCKCGFTAQKWEADLKATVTACVTCRRNDEKDPVQPLQ